MTQLSFSLTIPVAAPEKPTLSFEPVPFEISLASGQRYFIACEQGDRTFTYQAIQLTELEARVLLRGLSKLDWGLTESGIPRDLLAINNYVAAAVGGEV